MSHSVYKNLIVYGAIVTKYRLNCLIVYGAIGVHVSLRGGLKEEVQFSLVHLVASAALGARIPDTSMRCLRIAMRSHR